MSPSELWNVAARYVAAAVVGLPALAIAQAYPNKPIRTVEAGKVKMVAVNMDKRWKGTPQVPTLREVIPGYERPAAWMGYFGPAALPQPITRRLYAEIVKAMNSPETITVFDKLGLGIETSESPEAFGEQIKRQLAQAGALVKAANIEPE